MTSDQTRDGAALYTRRNLFKAGAALGGGLLIARAISPDLASALGPVRQAAATGPRTQQLHLAATDGWASMPHASAKSPFWPDSLAPAGQNVYIFGFRDVTGVADALVINERGRAQISAPLLGFDQFDPNSGGESTNNAVRITLSNLGLSIRPDLTDGHTIHWHGFNNAIPLFDGVPELSISVPIGRSFTYYYRPRDPGTYMYHCHFEDVEHVQMGMTGVVYVRPLRNAVDNALYAYDHASTRYDREYAFMLTELWVEAHYRDAHIQTTDWTDFKPSFWLLNGRAYPDTLQPSSDPLASTDPMQADNRYSLKYNPISSVVAAKPGERVLLRIANLGYQHHAMTLDGLSMQVIAKDAACLVDSSRDLTYETNTVEVGPGESRDVLVRIPTGDPAGPYRAYRLYDRNFAYLNNGGDAGYGGQITEVRVYPTSTAQSVLDAFKQTV